MSNEYIPEKAASSANLSENTHCPDHDDVIKFICTERDCSCHPYLCTHCLDDHRQHNWKTLPQFYAEMKVIVTTAEPECIRKLFEAEKTVKISLTNLKKKVQAKMNLFEQTILNKFSEDRQFYQKLNIKAENIQSQKIEVLLKAYRRNKIEDKNENWIQNMNFFIQKSLRETEVKMISILNDLQISFDTNWRKKTKKEAKKALKELKKEREEAIELLPVLTKEDHFKFHQSLTHASIALKENNSVLQYIKAKPKGPAAVASNSMTKEITKFAFQILTLTSTAFVFPDTTVMIGLCNSTTVKNVGLQRIADENRGAYLIGSTGWSYHNKNLDYNRKSNVGWTFGQGDIIEIEVIQSQAKAIFKKRGIFFDSFFQLPLELSVRQIRGLKPCVSFQGEIGCQVKLLNLYSEDE